jgi:propionyl-CoA carboxylase alpha chain
VGHAIEVRLYAEDPARDWLPQSGTLHRFDIPGVDAEFGLGGSLRVDSGVAGGSRIGVHYDPMLAKVIAFGATRAEAARRLSTTLARTRIHGLTTNRELLVNVLRHPRFLSGDTDTGFLDRHPLTRPLADPAAVRISALAAALAWAAANRAGARVLRELPSGWRNVASQPQRTAFVVQAHDGSARREEVAYRLTRDGLRAEGFDEVELVSATPDEVVLAVRGVRRAFAVAVYQEPPPEGLTLTDWAHGKWAQGNRPHENSAQAGTAHGDPAHAGTAHAGTAHGSWAHAGTVYVDSALGPVRLTPVERLPEPVERVAPGSLLAPMPGTVLRVDAKSGEPIAAGQPVITLEAMKLEHKIVSPIVGIVAALNVTPGRQVEAGAVLAVIEEMGATDDSAGKA